jgi:hypothetical protein
VPDRVIAAVNLNERERERVPVPRRRELGRPGATPLVRSAGLAQRARHGREVFYEVTAVGAALLRANGLN